MIDFKFFHRHEYHGNTTEREHNHPFHEIVYYVEGDGKGKIEKREYFYEAGALVFIPAGKRHMEFHETQTEVVFFAFDAQAADVRIEEGVYFECEDVYPCFSEIEQEIENMEPFFRETIRLKIEQILLKLVRKEQRVKERGLLDECMEYARTYIQGHLRQNVNFSLLAKEIGYSYDYFRHQFLVRFGVSPKKFVLKERMTAIRKELTDTDDSVRKIALRYSFQNASHLSRTFKKYVGCTPSEYREKTRRDVNEIVAHYEDEESEDERI